MRLSLACVVLAWCLCWHVPLSHAETLPEAAAPRVAEQELVALAQAEQDIAEARSLQLALDEAAALRRLRTAETLLLEHLSVPGVGSWLAEVWIGMANAAAQLGLLDLATSSLARAASLEPERPLEVAEVPPQLARQWSQLLLAQRTLPASRFRVELAPASAVLWIDGHAVEGRSLALAPGLHLLQVYAPGFLPFAQLIDTWSGERPALVISLAKSPVAAGELQVSSSAQPLPPLRGPSDDDDDARHRRRVRAGLWSAVAAVTAAAGVALTVALVRKDEPRQERVLIVDPGSTTPTR